jgi:hypothetical protein
MGFSFSSIRKELASESFRRFFHQLRAESSGLLPFPDHDSLISFFHDEAQDLDTKDSLLFDLVMLYRRGSSCRDLAPFFIALFTPTLASIYGHGKRKCPGIDRADLIQDICLHLIQVIGEIEITPYKVAGRIVGALRNRIRTLLNRRLREEIFEVFAGGSDEFGDMRTDVINDDREPGDGETDKPDLTAVMDHLVRIRQITIADRKMITATLIGDKSLKEIAPTPAEYERLKKRRQRTLQTIKKYLANHLKSKAE